MKRALIITISLLLFLSSILADTTSSTADLDITAYKEATSESSDYITVTVGMYDGSTASGIESSNFTLKDASQNIDLLGSDYALDYSYAFYIQIQSRAKADTVVTLTLSPFTSTKDSTSTVPVTYTYTHDSLTSVESGYVSVSGSRNNYYTYTYTPTLTFTSGSRTLSSGDSMTVSSNTTATLTHSVDTSKITRKKYKKSRGNYSLQETTTLTSLPSSNYDYLPGFTSNSYYLTTKSYFALSMTESDFNAISANTDYLATVTLTITEN